MKNLKFETIKHIVESFAKFAYITKIDPNDITNTVPPKVIEDFVEVLNSRDPDCKLLMNLRSYNPDHMIQRSGDTNGVIIVLPGTKNEQKFHWREGRSSDVIWVKPDGKKVTLSPGPDTSAKHGFLLWLIDYWEETGIEEEDYSEV